jgi:hypothetical protein
LNSLRLAAEALVDLEERCDVVVPVMGPLHQPDVRQQIQ